MTKTFNRFAPWFLALSFTLCGVPSLASSGDVHNYKPKAGFVPDGPTAIRIAVAVWNPIYGEREIARQAPYSAKLENGVWHVSGSLASTVAGREVVGGVAIAEIAKDDGRVLRVSHGK